MTYLRTCSFCQTTFKPSTANQRFCANRTCREKAASYDAQRAPEAISIKQIWDSMDAAITREDCAAQDRCELRPGDVETQESALAVRMYMLDTCFGTPAAHSKAPEVIRRKLAKQFDHLLGRYRKHLAHKVRTGKLSKAEAAKDMRAGNDLREAFGLTGT